MPRVARPDLFTRPQPRKPRRATPQLDLLPPAPPELVALPGPTAAEFDEDKVTAEVWAECCADPVKFAWYVLGIWCWRKQRKMLRLMARNDRVAIRSAQKCSKTNSIVIFGLWWLLTKPAAKVLVTSSTYDNIKSVFWAELKHVVRRARFPLGLRVPDDPGTGLQLADGRFLKGFSPASQEGWGGFSGPAMLFLIDEASGIETSMFEAMAGNLAGGGSLVMIGNPIQNDGPFFDAFHAHRAHWYLFSMSGWDTPNCTGEVVYVRTDRVQNDNSPAQYREAKAIPGLAAPSAMRADEAKYGAEHPFFITRRLGDFARESDDAIVPLGLVEKARLRWMLRPDEVGYVVGRGRLYIGLDPARFGTDATAIAVRRGRRVYEVNAIHGAKVRGDAKDDDDPTALLTQHVVAQVCRRIAFYNQANTSEDPRAVVNIDAGGGYGAGIADLLKAARWPEGSPLHGQRMCDVVEVNSAESADDEDTYYNTRTQLLFGVREWLEQSPVALPMAVSGPMQEEYDMLLADLIATRYEHDTRARKKAESKDDVKERLGRSPDRGDAIGLCCYTGGGSTSDIRSVAVPYPAQEAAQVAQAATGTGAAPGRSFVVSRPNY